MTRIHQHPFNAACLPLLSAFGVQVGRWFGDYCSAQVTSPCPSLIHNTTNQPNHPTTQPTNHESRLPPYRACHRACVRASDCAHLGPQPVKLSVATRNYRNYRPAIGSRGTVDIMHMSWGANGVYSGVGSSELKCLVIANSPFPSVPVARAASRRTTKATSSTPR